VSEQDYDEEVLRPTVMDVDLDAIAYNYHLLKKRAGTAEIMPILKANAYGHGLVPCAKVLEELGPWGFGVAFLEEAIILRNAGISSPILALGGVSGRQLGAFLDYQIDICASSVMKLRAINEIAKKRGTRARVHLKIDTGMGRIGIRHYNADTIFEEALSSDSCDIVGVFSHLADAESTDQGFTHLQLERFLESVSYFDKRGVPKPKLHIANSPGLLAVADTSLDIVRPGLSLFGVSPFEHSMTQAEGFRPAMSLKSEVVYFKVVQEGAYVSYGRTWQAPVQTRIATIAVGYGDGYPRALSNKGSVIIRGKRYPIVGRVCMDQFMVDLGPGGEAFNGDEVILVGEQGGESINVEELSLLSDIDPRDLMLRVAPRVPRRYTRSGKTAIYSPSN
jgi:alanine racemase